MPTNWVANLLEYRNGGAILGWNLESPVGTESMPTWETVHFRGWFLTSAGSGRITISQGGRVLASVPADLSRPDVARARGSSGIQKDVGRCGFDIRVPNRPGPFRLEATEPGGDGFILEITGPIPQPFALIGGNRHLFLGGDSNDSIGQFIEERHLSEGTIRFWTANFANMKTWEAHYNLRCILLVAPSKEEIFPEFYPYPRARRTVFDDFRTRFTSMGGVVPLHELRAQRHFAYSETDTHWTDQGACIAARTVLKHWGMDAAAEKGLPRAFSVLQRQGDLGVKLDPRRASYELVFAERMDKRLVFDNGVTNNGCLRIWRNPEGPVQGGCIVFGDSFGTNLAMVLSSVFSEVTYAYRPAAFDADLVKIRKPAYVVLQITQRFLHGQPDLSHNIFAMIADKLAGLPEETRSSMRRRMQNCEPEFMPLVQPIFDLLDTRTEVPL